MEGVFGTRNEDELHQGVDISDEAVFVPKTKADTFLAVSGNIPRVGGYRINHHILQHRFRTS